MNLFKTNFGDTNKAIQQISPQNAELFLSKISKIKIIAPLNEVDQVFINLIATFSWDGVSVDQHFFVKSGRFFLKEALGVAFQEYFGVDSL